MRGSRAMVFTPEATTGAPPSPDNQQDNLGSRLSGPLIFIRTGHLLGAAISRLSFLSPVIELFVLCIFVIL